MAFTDPTASDEEAVAFLRTPTAIRERCEQIFTAGLDDGLAHFAVDLSQLPLVAARVITVTRSLYPSLRIPPHSRSGHFRAGGVDRLQTTLTGLPDEDADERARRWIDLVVTSVLLDAGAGEAWQYSDPATGETFRRSEGLAVASLNAFAQGAFSADTGDPCRADASRLAELTDDELAANFQVTPSNPLVGLRGRTTLLRRLGAALTDAPALFGERAPRIGGLVDYFRAQAVAGSISATEVCAAILDGLGPIWPGRLKLAGVSLGDVGRHPRRWWHRSGERIRAVPQTFAMARLLFDRTVSSC